MVAVRILIDRRALSPFTFLPPPSHPLARILANRPGWHVPVSRIRSAGLLKRARGAPI